MDGAEHSVNFDSGTSISTVIETMGSSCCNPAFDGLENATRWVAWRTEPRGKEGKLTKVPKNPLTGHNAKSTDPTSWGTMLQAQASDRCVQKPSHGPQGIGLILGEWPDGHAVGGVDLDACRNPSTGKLEPWARGVLELLDTYAEVSPSQAGVKAFFRLEPGAVMILRAIGALKPGTFGCSFKRGTGLDHPPAIEIHLGHRFYTVTGLKIPGARDLLRLVPSDVLRELISRIGPEFRTDGDSMHAGDRSAKAFRLAIRMRANGATFEAFKLALDHAPELAAWKREKGDAKNERELRRAWDRAGDPNAWIEPDMSVLRAAIQPAPALPLHLFGEHWEKWITQTAASASCPPDYVAAPLLALASTLIGHARWAMVNRGWREPPHLWVGAVGGSGDGKTPGASCLLGEVIPALERVLTVGFPEKRRQWLAQQEAVAIAREQWKKAIRSPRKGGEPPPLPPNCPPEPIETRLKINDTTIEKVAALLAASSPKGMILLRDELAGWLLGMNNYNLAGRQFWLEAWNGHPFQVERQASPEPIKVPRLAVAVYGGIQPDRLAELVRGPNDGLFARFMWFWPDPVQFTIGSDTDPAWAIRALGYLNSLALRAAAAGEGVEPEFVPLIPEAMPLMETFGRTMQLAERETAGLLAAAYAKARGQALRLSLIFEFLWWCGNGAESSAPTLISKAAFAAAVQLMNDYVLPKPERVYQGVGLSPVDRNATTLAKWIVKTAAQAVHVRTLLREVRLPGLASAETIHDAAHTLVDLGWLRSPERGTIFGKRGSMEYAVNPAVHT